MTQSSEDRSSEQGSPSGALPPVEGLQFERMEAAKVEAVPAPGVRAVGVDMQQVLGAYAQQLAREQNPLLGVAASAVAAVIGAFGWALITVVTHMQIGYAAVGVGFLVGYAMRRWGKPVDKTLPVVAGALALIGCVAGNVLCNFIYVMQTEGMTLRQLIELLTQRPRLVWIVMRHTFDFMDGIFYVVAVWAGYRYAFRRVSREEVEAYAAARFPVVGGEARPADAGRR